MSKRTTIHIADRLEEAIGKNPPSLSGRLAIIGDRYLEILRRARIDKKITDTEFDIMRDATADVKFEPARLIDGALRQCLEEALRDGLQTDVSELAEKLDKLTYAEQVALVEAIEQSRS